MTMCTIAAMPMRAAIVTAPAGLPTIRRIPGVDAADIITEIRRPIRAIPYVPWKDVRK